MARTLATQNFLSAVEAFAVQWVTMFASGAHELVHVLIVRPKSMSSIEATPRKLPNYCRFLSFCFCLALCLSFSTFIRLSTGWLLSHSHPFCVRLKITRHKEIVAFKFNWNIINQLPTYNVDCSIDFQINCCICGGVSGASEKARA